MLLWTTGALALSWNGQPRLADTSSSTTLLTSPETESTSNGRCAWNGLPAAKPEPMECGLIWFVHIAKTGGRDIVTQIRSQSEEVLAKEVGGYQSVRRLRGNWTLAELWYDGGMSKEHPLYKGRWNETAAWKHIESQMTGIKRPKIIVHDHNNMVGFEDEYFFDGVLRPMACYLESRGCEFKLATLLREPSRRAESHVFFEGNVNHDNFKDRVASVQNYQTHYMLHNHKFHNIRPLEDTDRQRASEILQHFAMVGQTEDHDRFRRFFMATLGWDEVKSDDVDNNKTPEDQKMELTQDEQQWVAERNRLDKDLYDNFCIESDAGAQRQPRPICDRFMNMLQAS